MKAYEELDENALYWRNSLVGYFLGPQSVHLSLKFKAYELWGHSRVLDVLSCWGLYYM